MIRRGVASAAVAAAASAGAPVVGAVVAQRAQGGGVLVQLPDGRVVQAVELGGAPLTAAQAARVARLPDGSWAVVG